MHPSSAPEPRPRAEILAVPASADVIVELLCDLRDLVGECAIRLSDIEAQLAERSALH